MCSISELARASRTGSAFMSIDGFGINSTDCLSSPRTARADAHRLITGRVSRSRGYVVRDDISTKHVAVMQPGRHVGVSWRGKAGQGSTPRKEQRREHHIGIRTRSTMAFGSVIWFFDVFLATGIAPPVREQGFLVSVPGGGWGSMGAECPPGAIRLRPTPHPPRAPPTPDARSPRPTLSRGPRASDSAEGPESLSECDTSACPWPGRMRALDRACYPTYGMIYYTLT